MKKLVSFFVIVMLLATANLQVFSQKIRSVGAKRTPTLKTDTPIIKTETPIIKPQTPAGVKLKSLNAFSDGNGAYLRWETEYETQNLGFYLYRFGEKGKELVTEGIVPGGYTKSSENVYYGGDYSFYDPDGSSADSYFIESFKINGERQIIGETGTKQIENLQAFAGQTSQQLRRREESKPVFENNLLNLPKELRAEIDANTLPPDLEMQRWVAAQPGVKIGVKQEGLYRVSRAALQNAGFNVNAAGNLWQLYVDGKQQSIIVGANDSYIEFYGKGLDTPETDTKIYYLIVGAQDGLRMTPKELRPLSGSVVGASYFQTFTRKERKIYLQADILNGDEENFFGNLPISGSSGTPATVTYTFNLSGIDFNSPNAFFDLNIQGITATPHLLAVKLNGQTLDPISGGGRNLMSQNYPIPTSYLAEGANTLQIQCIGGAGDTSLVESFKVSYSRKFEAMQNRLSFYTNNYRQTTVSGFTSQNIRVFDMTFPDNPTVLTNLAVQNNSGNYSVTLPANRGRQVFAVEDSAILSASSIAANNPSSLSTPAHNGELIIVSYRDWLQQANDWANYRRSQGLTVEVVDIDDIQDEFSYGAVNTTGITQFFMYAKANWQTPPNYILLMGDMTYDFRNYENRAFQNFIPTKRVDTLYEETGSDEALCDFNNDGLAELAVGRIPARNAATVTQLLNKTMVFEANLATVNSRGALCASDLPIGYDFEGVCQRVFAQLPASISQTFVNRAQADSRTQILSNINQGRYIVNYSGHGSTGIWAEQNWFNFNDAAAATNAPNYSLFFMLTCLNGYFLRTDVDSLAEALLKAPNGGAVAVWSSTGKTTPDVQELLATRFYNQLNVSTMTKMGDFVMDAKQNLVGGRDVRLSWALLGDPTLKIKP